MFTPDEYPIAPGDVLLGKYRVENVLGRGAMGLVVAARHLALDDRVAIKVLLPKYVQDAEVLQRFLREGRAAVRIRSPHVVRVTDVGTLENGAPYMVMDHLEGKDLAAVLAESGYLQVPLAIERSSRRSSRSSSTWSRRVSRSVCARCARTSRSRWSG
ncbi:protein kinase domain-containing protein [Sorangium sp. So ce590]|uniref:protein kinase domain-containing protein n=1 Tax=unclassified Sorangium TaxID=2621164 RepID=UPI003F5E9636